MLDDLIREIHSSDAFGVFIELGCGNPVAHELCKIAGASNTIYFAENPYSKEFSKDKYKITERAVSAETILHIYQKVKVTYPNSVNTYYISSFQVGDRNNKSTHGYIGIGYKDTFTIYHLSINKIITRPSYIEEITQEGLILLYKTILPVEDDRYKNTHVDIVYTENTSTPNLIKSLIAFTNKNQSLLYVENGIPKRVEELLRRSGDELVCFKGSFNPVQTAHIDILNQCKTENSSACFSISSSIYGKEKPSIKDLLWRILLLNKLGYGVLINNYPNFIEMIKQLRVKTDKKLIFPMGIDTFLRIGIPEAILNTAPDVKIIVFDRPSSFKNTRKNYNPDIKFIDFDNAVSSTSIRLLISNYNEILNEQTRSTLKMKLAGIVPELAMDEVIDKFYWM